MPRPTLRGAAALALLLAGACVIHDIRVPREREISTRAATASIRAYRAALSPLVGRVVTCRFRPTCSAYGLEAVRKYGALRGGWKALVRIARCNPMTKPGTYDPP